MRIIEENHFSKREYDGTWHESLKYNKWVIENLTREFQMKSTDIFVDIGGGLGAFTNAIAQKSKLINKAICVDPSACMCEKSKLYSSLFVYNESTEFFTQRNKKYDKVLIKETAHLLSNRVEIFKNIYKNLSNNGKLILFTRPKDTSLPFFKKAKIAFSKSQQDTQVFLEELRRSGFSVNILFIKFPISIKKCDWYSLLKNRFMSNLKEFTDVEIYQGINEINNFNDSEKFDFNDDIILIVATKKQ